MKPLNSALIDAEKYLDIIGEPVTAQRLRMLRILLDQPELNVVIFGEFSRGKSTLINALLGREVLPAKLIPTTGHTTRLSYGNSEAVVVRFLDGREERHSLDQLGGFSTLNHDGIARDDVDSIEVSANNVLLKQGVVLIDTPGVNDQKEQTRRAMNAITQADLVLLVLDARQLLSSNERELATDWIHKSLDKPVVPVINFMNLIEENERAQIRLRLDRWCQEHLGSELVRPWFEINALGALKHVLGLGAPSEDDLAALKAAISTCNGDTRTRLQSRSRRGQLRHEIRHAGRLNSELLHRLREDAIQLDRDREELRNDLGVLSRRFDTRARIERGLVTVAAQKALDDRLNLLITIWFKGESRERLQANAESWYQAKLNDAIMDIEKEGRESLLRIASDHLERPEPLTIKEKMILNARLEVSELSSIAASPVAIGYGALTGAFWGTILFPVPGVGTALGAFLGGMLGNARGRREPDYVPAYSEMARGKWTESARKVIDLMHHEYDARVGEMKRQIAQRLVASQPLPPNIEISRREILEQALNECYRIL